MELPSPHADLLLSIWQFSETKHFSSIWFKIELFQENAFYYMLDVAMFVLSLMRLSHSSTTNQVIIHMSPTPPPELWDI